MNLRRVVLMLGVTTATLALATIAASKYVKTVYGFDHRGDPTADGLPEGSLADVYAFVDPVDSTRIDFIMDVNPFATAAAGGSYAFSPDMLYQFKIDNTGDAREDQVIQIVFDETGQTQHAFVYGPAVPASTGARNALLTTAPSAVGPFGTTIGSSTGVQAFVGLADDPSVFDLGQYTRILNSQQDFFRAVGTVFRGRAVRTDGTSGVDAFAGFNVTSIVVSVPKAMIRGSGPMINVWATVSQRVPTRHGGNVYQQFVRQGQQEFSTLFIPAGAARDAENAEIPEHDVANYSGLIPDALTTTDNDGTGNTIAGRANLLAALGLTALPNGAPLLLPPTFSNTSKDLLRTLVLPDVLRVNVDQAFGTLDIAQFGLQNGRNVAGSAIDISLQLLRQLADIQFPNGIPGGGPAGTRVTLNCTAYPSCQQRLVLAVLQGTQFIKPDNTVTTLRMEVMTCLFKQPSLTFPRLILFLETREPSITLCSSKTFQLRRRDTPIVFLPADLH